MVDASQSTRVVVLGANGFVGAAAAQTLAAHGFEVDAVSRAQIDLTDTSCASALAGRLTGARAVVFASAVTPDVARATGGDPTPGNMAMAETVAACAAACPGLQLVYLSSDAVYGLRDGLFNEQSPVAPDDDYGRMHVAREVAMREAWPGTCAILRLSQVYGPGDTHNAYGPCRFVRQALAGEPVTIFGEGEDARDHIWIGDVAEAIERVIEQRFAGVLCVSSGMSPSFQEVAQAIQECLPQAVIQHRPRTVEAVTKRFEATALRQVLGSKPLDISAGLPRFVSAMRDVSDG